MVWTYLRSCYGFPMRVFIGGREVRVKARWFFCMPGAQFFPSPHGAEASVWLQNFEVNRLWGEVTPWPQDPTPPNTWRVLDHGANPGYPGQCFVGERQWFIDGQLPADILSRPALPFPACCLPRTGQTASGLTLGGAARVASGPRLRSAGGLVLGGAGIVRSGFRVQSAGGLVLGGRGVPGPVRVQSAGGLVIGGTARAAHPARSSGGIALGGMATAHGGGVMTPCCPGVGIPFGLTGAVSAKTGAAAALPDTIHLEWQDPSGWMYLQRDYCTGHDGQIQLTCAPDSHRWGLTSGASILVGSAILTSSSCTPFRLTFAVTFSAACGDGTYTLTITP